MHGPSRNVISAHLTAMLERLAGSQRRADRQQAQQARRALKLLEAGTYGFCTDCGLEIPELRLLTRPEVTRCRRCERNPPRAISA